MNELEEAIKEIGIPCIIKPVMSSSGKGQIKINHLSEANNAWKFATSNMRGDRNKVIVEKFIDFESEITLLTVKQKSKETIFCPPIGHKQEDGDYQESWQPANIKNDLLKKAELVAKIITEDLGGLGLFGIEFFVLENEVIFSELSPRPHDTGMVTLFTQNLNEFDLHLRAILELPIPNVLLLRRGYSKVIKTPKSFGDSSKYKIKGLEKVLMLNNTDIRIFGKSLAWSGRRLGVILSSDRENAIAAKQFITIEKD